MSGDIDWSRIDPLADTFAVTDTLLKRFASGHGTQATILATRALMADGLVAEDIVHAQVRTATGYRGPPTGCACPAPGWRRSSPCPASARSPCSVTT